MNKSFLSKKSWHTGTLRNIEKVWLAEQREQDEKKRIAQLQRELQEQRQIEELKKIHGDAVTGSTTARRQEKLDWMYSEPISAGPSGEELLTGAAKFKENPDEDPAKQLEKKPGSLWINDPKNAANDMIQKLRDDPMLMIERERRKNRESIKDNPIKMKEMRDMINKLKEKKKSDKKKHKKHKKTKKDEDGDREASPKAAQDRGARVGDEDRRARSDRNGLRSQSPRQSRSRSRDRSPRRDGTGRDQRRDRSGSRDRNTRDRPRSPPRRDRSPERRTERERSRSPARRNRSPDRSARRNRSRSPARRDRSPARGHDRSRSPDRRNRRSRSRSPRRADRSRSPVRRERSPRRTDRSPKRSPEPESNSRKRKRSQMSDSERQQLLEQMKRDAEEHAEHRVKRIKLDEEQTKREETRTTAEEQISPEFINKMGQAVYNDRTTASLEDRVKRNAFYLQKKGLEDRGMLNKH